MNSVIPDDLRLFINENIDSVAELEALLILRHEPQNAWNVSALAARLYIEESYTREVLGLLCERGLAMEDARAASYYSYLPASAELAGMVDRLALVYSTQVVPITNLIHSKTKHKVQGFANAFKLRKDP